MIKINSLLILYMFFLPVVGPTEIYEGKKFPWLIYFDDTKENIVIEIRGIKFGRYDYLKKNGNDQNIIASSSEGKLYRKKNDLYYANIELKIDFKLEKKKYTSKIDRMRYDIYNTKSFFEISHLKDSLNEKDYVYSWDVMEDYEFFRNTHSFPNSYMPNYKKDFYEYINKK